MKTMSKVWGPLGAALLLSLFLPAGAAAAGAGACFTWDCTVGPLGSGYCEFDGSCSYGDPYVWKYNWDWGDGNGTGLTGQEDPSYDFDICYPQVTLTVADFSGNVESVTCTIHAGNACPGPAIGSTTGTCQ